MSTWANTPSELVKIQQIGESQTLDNDTSISVVHSQMNSCLESIHFESIQHFSCEDLESQEAHYAKKVNTVKYSALAAQNNKHEIFKPQSGELDFVSKLSTLLSDISKYAGFSITDDIIAEIEGLAALVITIQGCTDYISMSSAIFLYVRKFFDSSLTGHVMSYIRELFEFETQNGFEDTVATSDWIAMMRNLHDNWGLVRDNKFFSHFSKLLGLVVTLGMCKASAVTFTIKDYKIWEPDMKIVHGSAMDIADAALQTVVFFVESISLCTAQKSLKPLLVNDKAAYELDEEYATIVLWWDLVKNGNLKKIADVSECVFDNRLELLCGKLRNLLAMKSGFEKKLIQDKFMRLLKIKNDYITMKISSGVRKAPFVLELFGGSSQGKTTCADQLIDALLTSAGLPTTKNYRASYNASDKYMSTWTTDKLVLTIDDMANDKSSFVEKPPTRVIIDVCNNQPYYANMADLDSKGKIFVEPELVIVNTNVKDLDARVYSNCPYSIQRRMHFVITVIAKPEFQYILDDKPQGIDSAKVAAHYARTGEDPTFDDLWVLTVEKAYQPEKLTTSAGYKPVVHNDVTLKDVSFRVVVQFLIEQYQSHTLSQEHILERMRKREDKVQLCHHVGCRQISGYCDKHDNEPHRGFDISESLLSARTIISNRIKRDVFGFDSAIESACTLALMSSARYFAKHWDWVSCIPTPWMRYPCMRNLVMFADQKRLMNSYITRTCTMWSVIGVSLFVNRKRQLPLVCVFGAGLFAVGATVQKSMVSIVKRDYERKLVDRNTIAPMIQDVRDRHVGNLCKTVGVIGALYALSRVYKSWKALHPQGSLEPIDENEVFERDSEDNVWTSVFPRSLPVRDETATTTSLQLRGLVSKNLVYGTVVAGDKTYMVNGLFLKSNVVIIPNHYFVQDTLDVTFRKENPEDAGGKFPVRLSKLQSVLVKDTDIRICYASSGGSFKDITRFLPAGVVPDHEFDMLWRSRAGKLTVAHGLAESASTSNGECDFEGSRYKSLTIDTFRGLCGATLISRTKAIISGIHLGGKTGTPKGCSGLLTISQVAEACKELKKLEGVIISGSAENFESQILGVKILTGQPLHPKSPLNYMPNGSQVEYYGSCPGMTTFVSNVKPTIISEIVMDVTGEPNVYGPPIQFPQYVGWQTCLANLAVPAKPFEPELLNIAIKDYKEDLLPIFRSKMWCGSKPLNDQENTCGIPGKKFMDAIKLNTSIGYPLSGKKRGFVTELPPTDEKPNNRVFDPIIVEEIKRCEDCYRKGERAYPIAKACKKDEVLSKPKCRIFYGNSIALTFLIRKYFLPILRVLQMNPLLSECAVGVNSHGPEWEALHQHIHTFGEDRLIGGDYGKYDQKLPSQLLFASLRILIDFAKECDYTDTDISIMEALTGDIVYAVIAYNGDLIGLTEGTHISGNSLTVILNGICGSLNLRCYFYKQYPTADFLRRKNFRDFVKLVTYGDDNIGSVEKSITKFTIKGVSEFLASYGQVYTMPDKESELLDFLPAEEFEFLKRKSIYHPVLGGHVGALADKSCFKMLHCYIRDKNAPLTEEHACGLNIDTALREWFNHGEKIYEERRDQMKIIADKAGIAHLCDELDLSYDDRASFWRKKYIEKNYEMYNEPDGFTC
jgi:hypothetical protein